MTADIVLAQGTKDRVFRIYANGDFKDETKVLWPHYVPGEGNKTGYNGDVFAWSEHNKLWRWGCAQVMFHDGEWSVIYPGMVDEATIEAFIENQAARKEGQ